MKEGIKEAMEHGKSFAFDGCHKIYIIKTNKEMNEAIKMGYKIYPIKELEETYNASCPLKFISNWALTKQFVKQCE